MSKLTWDDNGQRFYETGVSHGVFYPKTAGGAYTPGVAWNGLTGITESPSGAEETVLWADNMKYLSLRSAEEYGLTIEAYTYPDEFAACDGHVAFANGVSAGQQPRKPFGLCYRTELGNDVSYEEYGYILHLVYGITVSPSEKSCQTINDSPEAITFSWEGTTVPIKVDGLTKPIAELEIRSDCSATGFASKLATLEAMLYGADDFDATSTYAVGDAVAHEGKLYICKTAISTAAAWDATKWDKISDTTIPCLPSPEEVKEIFGAVA